ncbi:MAG TPA: tetratricopeptide repeat protein [Candidatus Cybelea sp.]|nr:tetratricopeptide repeat protein [Candidatus Cybelea sp.]
MRKSHAGRNRIAAFLFAAGALFAASATLADPAAPALRIEEIVKNGARVTSEPGATLRALDGTVLRRGLQEGAALPGDVQAVVPAGVRIRVGAADIGTVTLEGATAAFHYTGSYQSVATLSPGRVEIDDRSDRFRFFGPGFELVGHAAAYAVDIAAGSATVSRSRGTVTALLLGPTAFVRRVDLLTEANPAISYDMSAQTTAKMTAAEDAAAAASGAANGEYNFGMRLYWGDGMPADAVRAMRYFQSAAAARFPEAENAIGYVDVYGPAVMQDTAHASRWLLLAAAGGSAAAEDTLGDMYNYGHGVVQSYADAIHWYQLSAAEGDADAENDVGLLYYFGHTSYFGEATPQYAEAMRWFRIAAAQGNGDAENDVGYAYEHGHGVPQDNAEALYWYRLAAAQGVAAAAAGIKRIESMKPQ